MCRESMCVSASASEPNWRRVCTLNHLQQRAQRQCSGEQFVGVQNHREPVRSCWDSLTKPQRNVQPGALPAPALLGQRKREEGQCTASVGAEQEKQEIEEQEREAIKKERQGGS